LVTSLIPAGGGEPLASVTSEKLPEDELRVSLPLPEMAPGDYTLKVALQRAGDGETLCVSSHRLQRRTGPMPRCFIDRHNRLIAEGKPFFPLGMYWGSISEEELEIYDDGPFNCIMPYSLPREEQLDMALQHGIRVIYSIKDFYAGTRWCPDFIKGEADEEPKVREWVQRFRDHPALIAWYLNDELPLSMRERLEAHQRWVEEEDPNHPTWVVLYQVNQVGEYAKTFDVIGTDPYPIGKGRPLSMAADWTIRTREAVDDARPLWMVPQAFQWKDGDRRPSRAEMRSMAWQCICEGADGLVFYSWSAVRRDKRIDFEEYWADMLAVAGEINKHIPALLSIEPNPELEVSAPGAIHWMARTLEGVTWLFMVNDSDQPVEAGVQFAAGPASIAANGRELACPPDGRVTVGVEPMGLTVLELRW
ncbi:MAG: beta-galactosidase, partial [Armatimonadetes bacterium]|nr:beta-galactosidase [Armatimonadota bacterium]